MMQETMVVTAILDWERWFQRGGVAQSLSVFILLEPIGMVQPVKMITTVVCISFGLVASFCHQPLHPAVEADSSLNRGVSDLPVLLPPRNICRQYSLPSHHSLPCPNQKPQSQMPTRNRSRRHDRSRSLTNDAHPSVHPDLHRTHHLLPQPLHRPHLRPTLPLVRILPSSIPRSLPLHRRAKRSRVPWHLIRRSLHNAALFLVHPPVHGTEIQRSRRHPARSPHHPGAGRLLLHPTLPVLVRLVRSPFRSLDHAHHRLLLLQRRCVPTVHERLDIPRRHVSQIRRVRVCRQ